MPCVVANASLKTGDADGAGEADDRGGSRPWSLIETIGAFVKRFCDGTSRARRLTHRDERRATTSSEIDLELTRRLSIPDAPVAKRRRYSEAVAPAARDQLRERLRLTFAGRLTAGDLGAPPRRADETLERLEAGAGIEFLRMISKRRRAPARHTVSAVPATHKPAPYSRLLEPFTGRIAPEASATYVALHRQKLERLRRLREWHRTVEVAARAAPTAVEGLSPRDVELVERFWRMDADAKVGAAYRVDLYVKDLQTLMDRKWLNDSVIDVYLADVCGRTNGRCFAFTTHFYTRLAESGYGAVKKWAARKKVNVSELDYLFVPVNRGNTHWCLAVVNNRERKFQFYDSLCGNGSDALRCVRGYMISECDRLKLGTHAQLVSRFGDYEVEPSKKCPQQTNGYDCGVFVCQFVEHIARGSPLSFSQADMTQFRRSMVHRLLKLAGAQ